MDMDPRLLDAARCGNQIKIIELEDSESNIIYGTTPQGNTALHVAARFGYYFMVSDIIRRHPSLVLKTNLKGETAIHLAARAGHEDVVSAFIITVGDSIQISRITDNHGNTPLHAAVKNKHYSIVKAIAEKDQDSLVLLNDDGESVLSIAIDLISTDLAAKIINLNTSTLEYRGHDGQTPLHRAVIRQDIATVNLILQWKKDLIKEEDEKKRSALHYAAELGNNKIVKLLLATDTWAAYKVDKDQQQTPLHLAAENGQVSVLKSLVESCPAALEILNKKQQNILHLAAKNGNLKAVSYILQLQEKEDLVNSQDVDGNTPLHLAATSFHSSVVRQLSKKLYVDIRLINNNKRTALAIVKLSDDNGMEVQKHLTLKALKNSYKRRAIKPEDVSEDDLPSTRVNKVSRYRAMAQTLYLMATLIATFTFTAAFTLPGGFRSNAPDEGLATLISIRAFQAFVITDTISMTSSLTAAVLVFWASTRSDEESFLDTIPYAIALTWVSLIAMALAFVTGLFAVLSKTLWLAILVCTIGCLAPFSLYILAPLILLLFESISSSRASTNNRRNIIEDNPFLFIIRLVGLRL